jgi:hypothetical protein
MLASFIIKKSSVFRIVFLVFIVFVQSAAFSSSNRNQAKNQVKAKQRRRYRTNVIGNTNASTRQHTDTGRSKSRYHSTFTKHYIAPVLPKVQAQISPTAMNVPPPTNYTYDHQTIFSPSVLKSNEEECLTFICGELPVTYTNDANTIRQWMSEHIFDQEGRKTTYHSFLGVDVESVPNAEWIRPKNPCMANRPATIQLSSPHAALVIHLTSPQNSQIIPTLANMLKDDSILKVGVGIDDDMLELYRWDNRLNCSSRFDIGGVGSTAKRNRVGLQKLTKALVGVEIPKTKRISRSDWSQVPLSEAQLIYAARDAWAGAAVMKNIHKMNRHTHIDVIADMVKEKERPMIDVHVRARKRRKAKRDFKDIMDEMKALSTYLTPAEEIRRGTTFSRLQLIMPQEVRTELDRLQKIIDDTSPDGLLFFDAEELGFDFTFG